MRRSYRLQFFDLSGKDAGVVDMVTHDPKYPAAPTPDHIALTFGKSPRKEKVLAAG